MKDCLTLYHGSRECIEHPEFGKGKLTNDYGQGFYCTEFYDLASEWASKMQGEDGYVNQYTLQTKELRILDLTNPKYNILNWMTLLLKNRTFALSTEISIEAKEYLINHFSVDVSGYDIITGYRADDSYFSFAEDFLNNTISVEHLSRAMKLGKLGIQYVLVSEKAFNALTFEKADLVANNKYYPLYQKRDLVARQNYRNSKSHLKNIKNELYVIDIIREEIQNGDPRI